MSTRMNVLLVEDNEVDVVNAERAFARYDLADRLVVVNSGAEALQLLRSERGRELMQRPLFVLLDLIMPEMTGFEFLRQIRADPELAELQVIVTTGLEEASDIDKAYDLGANGYVVKPVNYERFIEALGKGDFDRKPEG